MNISSLMNVTDPWKLFLVISFSSIQKNQSC